MNLLEHQAKQLLTDAGLPTPTSWLVGRGDPLPDELTFPAVAKSQVPVGGRGKAGGILTVETTSQATAALDTLFSLPIKGHRPRAILFEIQLDIARELYLSLRVNRDTRQLEWLASPQGGIDIETHSESVVCVPVTQPDAYGTIATALGTDEAATQSLMEAVARCMSDNDLLLIEINPLVETPAKELLCADAKCIVDDNARFRHPDLPWPPLTGNVPTPLGGSIGCIANGAGMAMSTMDMIVAAGGQPANFLDIGGGTGENEFVTALKQITELPAVTSIIVNIFAGISRCDEIARGIIAARQQLPALPPLFIRLEGTNRDEAVQLLEAAGIAIEPDLKTCISKAMETAR